MLSGEEGLACLPNAPFFALSAVGTSAMMLSQHTADAFGTRLYMLLGIKECSCDRQDPCPSARVSPLPAMPARLYSSLLLLAPPPAFPLLHQVVFGLSSYMLFHGFIGPVLPFMVSFRGGCVRGSSTRTRKVGQRSFPPPYQ